MTKGEQRVGVGFNPSEDPLVDEIKAKCAFLIDRLEGLRGGKREETEQVEVQRWFSLAQTDIETACMYAVKAITAP